jgi:nitroreductase
MTGPSYHFESNERSSGRKNMDLYQCMESRRSFRSFLPKAVDRATLTRVLEAANRSPSYMNTQPWEVFVVDGEKKAGLAKRLLEEAVAGTAPRPDLTFPKEWPDAVGNRAKDHRLRRFKTLGVDPDDAEKVRKSMLRNYEFHEAPCVLFVGMDKSLTPWSVFDLGLFTTSVLLAAQAEGLGTCIQALSMSYPDLIRDELGIPPTISLIVAICMGYPDMQAEINQYHSTRRDVSEFVKLLGSGD